MAVLAAALTGWLVAGANTGWTKTSVEVKTVDEVTGIEGITYEKRFLPGIELLGLCVLVSTGVAGASFFFRGRRVPEMEPAK